MIQNAWHRHCISHDNNAYDEVIALDRVRRVRDGKVQVHQNHFHQKNFFIKIHIHQKPLSSKTTFIKNHFHQKPLSSKTNFIKKPISSKNHFHQKPISSKTSFIKNHFHQKPLSSKTISHPSKNNIDRVCVKASRAEGPTPSHKHGLCPPLGSQPAFLLNIAGRRLAMFSRKAG